MVKTTKKRDRDNTGSDQNREHLVTQKFIRCYLPICLIIAAVGLRMIYGFDLPLNADEEVRIVYARTLSLSADHFNMPLGDRRTNHPILSAYIVALANWLGQGSIHVVRIVFIVIHTLGLVGLFYLARLLFGYRTANIALLLAGLDHHLISYAPVFLEPVYLCLVPWVILATYKSVALDQYRHWLLLGLCLGIGYQCSEIFILLSLGISIYVFYNRKAAHALKTREVYLALFIFFLLLVPNIIWNISSQAVNIIRHTERVSSWGLVPRVLLLYIGDFLICFKNSSWWVMGRGYLTYGIWYIPCHWVTGFVYLGSLVYSLRFIRDRRWALLHCFVWGIFLPVSLINANEPWNEFGWASMTVYPVILITAAVFDKIIDLRWGHIVSGIVVCVFTIYTAAFLSGLKFGYASPSWEKAFLGKVLYYYHYGTGSEQRKIAEAAAASHPDSAVAHYYKGFFAKSVAERDPSYRRVLEIEHFNPLVHRELAKDLLISGQHQKARKLLRNSIEKGNSFVIMHRLLGQAEYNLGKYSEAEKQIRIALGMKPDEFSLYQALYYIKEMKGEYTAALEALDRYSGNISEPFRAYLSIADKYARSGDTVKAAEFYKKAVTMNPDLPDTPPWAVPGTDTLPAE